MMKMNKKVISLAACALVLIVGLSVKPAMAYFTATVSASGKVNITIDDTRSEIHESGEGHIKEIVIRNVEATDAFVRVKVIVPDNVTFTDNTNVEGSAWKFENGYYVYNRYLNGFTVNEDSTKTYDETSELVLTINTDNAIKLSEDTYADFNVIVVPESAKVLYDAEGNTYADWDQEAKYVEGGNN